MKSTNDQQLNPQIQTILNDYFNFLFRTITTAATETNNLKLGLAAFKALNADAVDPDLEITEQEITEFSEHDIWHGVQEAIKLIQEPSLLNLKSHNNGVEPEATEVQRYIESLIKTACNDFDSRCSKEKARIKNKQIEEEERKRKYAEWEQGIIDQGLPSLEFFVYSNNLISIQKIVEKEKHRSSGNWYMSHPELVFTAIKKAEELGHQQIVAYFFDDANLKKVYTTTLEKERLQKLEDRIAKGLSSLASFVKENNLPAIQRIVAAEKIKFGAQWYSHKYYEIQDAIEKAFINNHSHIIKYLLQEGVLADSYIEDKNEHLFDFLVYAAEYDNDEVIAFLESLRPNIQPPVFPETKQPPTQKETTLRRQIQNDYNRQQIRMTQNWDTAFRRAIRSNKLKVAEYYLTQGKRNAESNCVLTKIAEGSYAIFNNLAIAILNQNTPMIELLLKHGASIVKAREQIFDAYKEKKLSFAFYKGTTLPDELSIYQKAIKLLLDYSAGHHLNGSSLGDTSMNLEFLTGLDISHFNFIGISIFKKGRPRLIEPRDLVNLEGHERAFYTHEDSLVLLQSDYSRIQGHHSDEVNEERYKRIKKNVNSISLDRAIRTGNIPMFIQHLGEGIDLNTLATHPLQLATQYGQFEIAQILLDLGFVNEDILNKAIKSLTFYERYPDLVLLLTTYKKQAGLEEAPQPASSSSLVFFANTESDLTAPAGNPTSSLTNQGPL
jgi:hypothetical protein